MTLKVRDKTLLISIASYLVFLACFARIGVVSVQSGCADLRSAGFFLGGFLSFIFGIPVVLFHLILKRVCRRWKLNPLIPAISISIPTIALALYVLFSVKRVPPEWEYANFFNRLPSHFVKINHYGIARGIGEKWGLFDMTCPRDRFHEEFKTAEYEVSEFHDIEYHELYNLSISQFMTCPTRILPSARHWERRQGGRVFHVFWDEKSERVVLWIVGVP